jgi:hypothetical protein
VSSWCIYGGYAYGGSATNNETFKFYFQEDERTSDVDGSTIYSVKAVYNSGDLNFGDRVRRKSFNQLYVEGFITPSTALKVSVYYEINGIKGIRTGSISGSESDYILQAGVGAEIGLDELGIEELGYEGSTEKPKFRVIFTTAEQAFNEMSVSFESDGEDQDWSVLAWGTNAVVLDKTPINLKKSLI